MGSTVADCHGVEGKEPNVSVGISSDRDRFIELMLDACKKYENWYIFLICSHQITMYIIGPYKPESNLIYSEQHENHEI